MQSETNATEGVGLLQVADGALSQVTSLLNRSITLATEASNGTLNSTQEAAANQEYQSILAEINNIGSTTTYNQQQVFNDTTTAIYTGDSSQAGSSVDDVYIRNLSSSSIGDTDGTMSYSSGQNNVFIDLSAGGKNASASDSLTPLGGGASTTITVNYLAKGGGGTASPATLNITVGAGTTYANTAQGLIDAINDSGLGLSASFGTATQAGTASESAAGAANTAGGGASDTGIIISGQGVGTGTNGPGEVGTLTIGNSLDTLTSGTLAITDSSGKTHSLTLGQFNSTDTLANLASNINAAGYGVTATVNSSYLNGNPPNTVLTLTSASSNVTISGQALLDSGGAGDLKLSGTPTAQGTASTNLIGTMTTTVGDAAYAGTSILNIGSNAPITLGSAGTTDDATDLAATINEGNYGVTASVNAADTVISFYSANPDETFSETGVLAANQTATNNAANQNQLVQFVVAGGAVGDDTAGTALTIDGVPYNGGAGITLTQLAQNITNDSSGALTATAAENGAGTAVLFTIDATGTAARGAQVQGTFEDSTHGPTIYNAAATLAADDTPAVGITSYYSVGITGALTDTSTGGGSLNVGMVANQNGLGGIATTSYADDAGENLSSTDLLSQSDAETALNELNLAITDASALDGYVGAQINTLNAISQVMSTQQENVVSAQNAVQATDYASATSNMSKYEILSQTGIAALAQANQVQQEVTKLLQ
jgi:flagellin